MFPFSNVMFPFSALSKKQSGFNPFQFHTQMMNQHPMMKMGMNFNPFLYDQQQLQEENPFSHSFFQPQMQQMNSQKLNQQQMAHFPQQNFPTGFPGAFFKDANGKLDMNKIGGGVQSALSLVNQMGPMMKMFGFFK